VDARPSNRGGVGRFVVVVDDDLGMRMSLQFLLESLDYRVATFANGDSFIEAIDGLSPDCLILDVQLPRETGFELLGRLAARRPPPPTIFVTGHLDGEAERGAHSARAVALLEKPFSDTELLGALDRALAPR